MVAALRQLLSSEEWIRLPELIAARRAQRLPKLASDRERAEARKEAERREAEEQAKIKAEEERRQREIERERERQERERRQAEEAKVARKKAPLARIRDAFASDFLSADEVFAADPDAELVSTEEYSDLKIRFVQDWAFGELRQTLDPEQAAAVATIGGDIQVVARTGSGKTRTLVTRAIFLQKHCRVSPRALLLLAFNTKAAEEMKSRLAQALGEDLPHVMTFHALAYALVHPEEELLFDDTSADQLGLSREVQEVIDEHLRSKEHRDRIRNLMLAHFREDWERIVDGRFQLTMSEFLAHRRALPRESLKGEYVKSFGEKVIANALFEHGVDYRYERNFRWDGVNYRPDFTIRTGRKEGWSSSTSALTGTPTTTSCRIGSGDSGLSAMGGHSSSSRPETSPERAWTVSSNSCWRSSKRQEFLGGAGRRKRSGSSSGGERWTGSRRR
jgi:DNA helicase IV